MKTIRCTISILTMLLLIIHSGKSQELRIDSTFQASGVFYPFQSVDTITGLSFSGEVTLNADTSLVRILLVTNDSSEFMIFEAYPLIAEDLEFTISDTCDETCYLDEVLPYSVKVQVINAEIEINSLYYEEEVEEDLPGLQHTAKRSMDSKKITILTDRILDYGMYWTAGDNNIVEKYYYQKKYLFGEAYNLLGYDYHTGGVFEFIGHRDYPQIDPDMVRQFDWRDRHGANDSLSPYWDEDTLNTGWHTSVKNQNECGSCWAFSAVGTTEVITNLYTVDHMDLDLAEQYLVCSDAGDCDGGEPDDALDEIISGIVTEYCAPYIYSDSLCDSAICFFPDTILYINNYSYAPYNFDSVRKYLINYGPMTIAYNFGIPHAVVLSGFRFNPVDSTAIWIIKDSKGSGVAPDYGFKEIKLESLYRRCCFINPPILINSDSIEQHCYDKDSDGYYFWGVGPKPDTLGSEVEEDCDDSNPYVGGYDENFNCECLLEMDTIYHHISSDTTWSDTTYVNYVLMVNSGVVFTINTYVGFAPEAKIVVKPGAELVIDSAHLT